MEHLENILKKFYQNIDNKWIFIPLCVSSAIIWYKLAHNDEVFWMNFTKQAEERKIESVKDIYLFYLDFLPKTNVFDKTFLRQVEHLKQFHIFLEEILYKQKFYYKNIDAFEKNLLRWVEKIPNPMLPKFAKEIFIVAAKIKFEE